MIIHNMEQGSLEWFEAKHGTIGGTRAKSVMVDKKPEDKDVFDSLLAEKSEDYVHEDGYVSPAMIRGMELEPIARKEACEYTGCEFVEYGLLQNSNIEIGVCSPDGMTQDFNYALEIKCPSPDTHIRYLINDIVPKEYFWQCINYFAVNPTLETLYFMSYRPENKHNPIFIKEMKRNTLFEYKIGRKPYKTTVDEAAKMLNESIYELYQAVQNKLEELKF
jgi:hypothetical protein